MDMINWAENEVKIACERERHGSDNGEGDYGCFCYESALKAYKSLCEDEHSGMSFSITRAILNRLMGGNPLTPIEDVPEVWNNTTYLKPTDANYCEKYQCKRMSSLFKNIYPDGTVKYSDVNRITCYNLSVSDEYIEGVESTVPFHNGYISRLIDDMFPITMPYAPDNKPYTVYIQEFLYDEHGGDYDTMGVMYLCDPHGKSIPIHRYFKDFGNSFAEIDEAEYKVRKFNRVRRMKND